MTALQILDRVAFCIGYVVIGGVGFVIAFGIVAVIRIGLKRDSDKQHDD